MRTYPVPLLTRQTSQPIKTSVTLQEKTRSVQISVHCCTPFHFDQSLGQGGIDFIHRHWTVFQLLISAPGTSELEMKKFHDAILPISPITAIVHVMIFPAYLCFSSNVASTNSPGTVFYCQTHPLLESFCDIQSTFSLSKFHAVTNHNPWVAT